MIKFNIAPPRASLDQHAQYLYQQGLAQHHMGQIGKAKSFYKEVLKLRPKHAEALHLLGVVELQSGNHAQAVSLIERAIGIKPDLADAYLNKGNALYKLGQHEAAIASFDQAIRLRPTYADAWKNRGFVLNALRQYEAAIASFDEAIRLIPQAADAYSGRGFAQKELKQYDAALASFQQAIDLNPDHVDAYTYWGNTLFDLRQFEDALACYEHARELAPNDASVHSHLGSAQREVFQHADALRSYQQAITLQPDLAETYCNRGLVLQDLNQQEAAIAHFDKAISLSAKFAEAHWNKSLSCLRMGDFTQGWNLYEWRWKMASNQSMTPQLDKPLWLGQEPLQGRRILLLAEQGMGDSIQFCRYAKRASDLEATVILSVPKPLVALMHSLDGVSQVVCSGDALPDFDCYCPLMSLPLAFQTQLHTIPNDTPYLRTDASKKEHWRQKLQAFAKPKVGLVWSGGYGQKWSNFGALNRRRNVSLEMLHVFKNLNVHFFSLQKGEAAEAEFASILQAGWDGPEIHNYTPELVDFSDTAAFIANLDLVISVDTAVAHLTGALGKPVWMLNRFDSCWRWLANRSDSPWYPTMKLYTQMRIGHWEEVVESVRCDLKSMENAAQKDALNY